MKHTHDYEDASARAYSRLVTRLVRPFFLRGGDRDDLYQEGMIGLLGAIRTYDPTRSDSFEAYAVLCIRSRLYDAARSSARLTRRETLLFETLEAACDRALLSHVKNPETLLLANESAKELQSALGGLLSAFESSVLGPYLEGYTVNEIAARLERPAKSVDNAIQRIRRKLAKHLQGDNRH